MYNVPVDVEHIGILVFDSVDTFWCFRFRWIVVCAVSFFTQVDTREFDWIIFDLVLEALAIGIANIYYISLSRPLIKADFDSPYLEEVLYAF